MIAQLFVSTEYYLLVLCYVSNLVSISNPLSKVTFSYLWFVFGVNIKQTIKYCSNNWHCCYSECCKIQRPASGI